MTPLQRGIPTSLLGSLEVISQPQHLPPRALKNEAPNEEEDRAREEEGSPPKVCAKGGEPKREKGNHLLTGH